MRYLILPMNKLSN